ncbi:MAG: recombinase family protein [Parcubacteria group bacterium]|nr:recombinase family protein [Parcubacteria group bacterium]
MKTILFARVSSREQEDTGYSLPSQEKLLGDYAQKKGFEVARKFAIAESACGKNQRKTFNEMLSYVKKNNIKVIVCEKVDRLTRNLKDAVFVNEWINGNTEREVHFVKEGCVLNKDSKSNEKFIWNIKISVAQYYIDNLSEEVKKGQAEKIRQGWLPTKPPLGYKTVGEKGHKIHIVDKEKAGLIKKMFTQYSGGGYSIKKLGQTIYEEGLRTRGNNKLAKSRVGELLSDPFYYGKIRWNNKIYEGKQEPLVSKELFDNVQQVLKSKTTPKYRKHFYLFKGSIKCKECGGKITWEKQKGITYGHCNHYRDCSQRVWVKEPELETQISKKFENLRIKNQRIADWIRRELKKSHKDEINYHSSTLNELKQRHEQIQKRLDRLYDDKLDERIDKDFYDRKFQQYSEEKDVITGSMEKHSNTGNKHFELGINIFDLAQRAKEIFQKANLEEKRQLIGLISDNLSLDGSRLSFTYSKPFEVLFEAVKFTNSSKIAKLAKTQKQIFEPSVFPVNINKNRVLHPEFAELLRG